ncbi:MULTISPECIES: L-rhamnose mutarotase [Sphingobacterium]|uniref:L-rhamnose mutarotase n=1 Tax=Sphingobacterium litopenaei TaxID=2763500 RepID=A0ABR7YDH2_9SPHI|nr:MULTISPECIES: L-rhamnose mutarotase [Sphingobacterium]MBD1429352.1 L-rhamnose mutarotase [Sphingobacterium litopenaei]NGM71935.1 L-rhamnose mutarotase [Sphingobacterium sp. SGL-16]
MKRYALGLDLVNDPKLIQEYEEYHKAVWPEIKKSIADAGIENMEIYRFGNRLFMLMETAEDFDFSVKAEMDASNSKVQEWEQLMWKYQQAIPGAKEGEKWVLMDKIFQL